MPLRHVSTSRRGEFGTPAVLPQDNFRCSKTVLILGTSRTTFRMSRR